jgi:hypothetical protein
MDKTNEPKVTYATVRDALDELHIECRFNDGQKFSPVKVDNDFPELANQIANALNTAADQSRVIEVMRTALEHYANKDSWKSGRGGTMRIYQVKSVADNGYDVARSALDGLSSGSNYTANDDTFPTEVAFANGRKVSIAFDGDKPYLAIGGKGE